MRIAIHNSFFGQKFAETELVRRIIIAAQNLGWESIETNLAQEMDVYKPDFVLVTHFNTPKLSQFPTYGCMWNPPIFFDRYAEFKSKYVDSEQITEKHSNILSYDAYLSSSNKFDYWLSKQLDSTAKKYFIVPFFTSCNQTEYITPNLQNPQLVYIGSNWDGNRFKNLFKGLDCCNFMQVYGSRWDYLRRSYRGNLPFDGVSVLKALQNAGVGLCLHRHEHTETDMPSMRIFEIVASGAIAICGEHTFIRNAFGDSVLYVETDARPSEQVKQINNHMQWIQNHPQKALEMSKQAHEVFLEKFTLEKLLLGIIPHHQKLLIDKGFVRNIVNFQPSCGQVEFIVRVGDRSLSMLKRCLDSIANQTYNNIRVILISYKKIQGLETLLCLYKDIMDMSIVESDYTGFRSSQIRDGLNNLRGTYFAIVDDDDVIYPNHTYILVSILNQFENIGVAYSGAIKVWERFQESEFIKKELTYFKQFDPVKIAKFQNFITSNSFIARSSLLTDVYQEDPCLETAEDFYLILQLCSKTLFMFSHEITCQFYWRDDIRDNVSLTEIDSSNRLWKSFENANILFADKLNQSLEECQHLKLSELRHSKVEKLLGSSKSKVTIYSLLRELYLNLSKGGKFNKSPNIVGKFLIFLKQLFLE
ncbi:glycosyltransferase [Pseudanabaena sp. FACHB-1277]|uniref:Glycosyltransferase n=1 Tax=Pseudanabaena cinerea FACHB-1277 TaxID=2949581 RepID=A0A926Z455_9CYAN|nr:glycosyltransferase [Pseudanabaena cinerea]MBD2148866.1 glycosyltransferase [Pseudanabaena cinerea FACHB-1277]